MSGCLLTMALVFFTASKSAEINGALDLGDNGIIALVAANLYVFFFNLTWGPVGWVMIGEMFPNQIRGPALAVSGGAGWMSNFLVTVSFPILLAGIGLSFAYLVYFSFALLSTLFVIKFLRETKGIELEDMS